jgi:regulatory protein
MLESRAVPSDNSGSRSGRTPRLLDANALWNYALKILSVRSLSTGEVRDKLRRKAENPEDIDGIISRLRDSGYLNDSRFAEGYARARRDTQGFGKIRVLRDLRQRRVAPNVAARAVEGVFEDADETEMIEAFLRRKYRTVDLPVFLQEDRNLRSAYRRLISAGFSSGASIRVLKRYAAQADQLQTEEDFPGDSL